jgi:hypothetical protein
MKVSELMDRLRDFPDDAEVLVQHRESGFTALVLAEEKEVCQSDPTRTWGGEWDDRYGVNPTDAEHPQVAAVLMTKEEW